MSCSHDCYHTHTDEHADAHTLRGTLLKWGLAVPCFVVALLPIPAPLSAILFGASILIAAFELLKDGLNEILHLRLAEDALMLVAIVASFALGEYAEAAMVALLFEVGELLEDYAVGKSRSSTDALSDIRPDFANLVEADGTVRTVDAKTVAKGSKIRIRPGDRIPLDCVVLDGTAGVDTAAITGESAPIYAQTGVELLSGSVDLDGVLTCRTTSDFEASAASRIVEMVYSSTENKGASEKFITRFSRVYTPIVVLAAVLLAVLPPLFTGFDFKPWVLRALIFLVASCPCALVLSVPLSFFSTVGALSKAGILVKGSTFIEALSRLKAVAFDKTGTLTSGALTVDRCVLLPDSGMELERFLRLAASAEQASTHPAARAVVQYAGDLPPLPLEQMTERAGLGVTAVLDGQTITCGNARLMRGVENLPPADIYVAAGTRLLGYFTLREEIPDCNRTLIRDLRAVGIRHAVMLTGASDAAAKAAANRCDITDYRAGLLPEDKVRAVRDYRQAHGSTAFVGDGINDAPVLAEADVGVSMGFGTEIANAASDVILAGNRLADLCAAIRISKRGMRIMRANVIFALAVKAVVLLLGAFGLTQMWMAVFADIGVTLLTVLNSIRILKVK